MLYDRDDRDVEGPGDRHARCRCIIAGQVTDEYATWTDCSGPDARSGTTTSPTARRTRFPIHSDKQQYCVRRLLRDRRHLRRPVAGSGVVANVRIVRWNPGWRAAPRRSSPRSHRPTTSRTSCSRSPTRWARRRLLRAARMPDGRREPIYRFDDADTVGVTRWTRGEPVGQAGAKGAAPSGPPAVIGPTPVAG